MNRAGARTKDKKAKSALRLVIASDLSELEKVCLAAGELLKENGLADKIFAVDLLLREFVNNAILHGNGANRAKRVSVAVRIREKSIVMSIADEGTGFDWLARELNVPDSSAASGRGLAIGRLYADRMTFNRAGNRVELLVAKNQSMAKEGILHE